MFLVLLGAIALVIIFPLTVSFSLSSLRYLRYSQEEIADTAELAVISARKLTEMYQDTISQAATLVLMDPAMGEIASTTRLDDVRGSFDRYQKLSQAVSLLTSMTYIGSLRVESVYFYIDGADYIITSDQGAVRLSRFSDLGYRDVYEALRRNPHASIWTVRNVPVSTVSGDKVEAPYLTYANMANPIVSKVRGAILVNIRETVFSSLINTSEFDRGGHTFIVDAHGVILSHVDKALILGSTSGQPTVARLLGEQGERVAVVSPGDGGRPSLFVSAYSAPTSWTLVSEHSLDVLTDRVQRLTRRNVLAMLLIVLGGSAVVVVVSDRLSIPLRKLLSSLSQLSPVETRRGRTVNEFEYLLEWFQRMREHEAVLNRKIEESRDRMWESYIVDVLHGDLDKHIEPPFPDSRILPRDGWFRVVTISLDRRSDIEARFSQEQRSSYLSLLSAECRAVFSQASRCTTVLVDGNVSLILGDPDERPTRIPEMSAAVAAVQKRFASILGSTLTAGISDRHRGDLDLASRAYIESMEAVKRRIVEGHGGIHVWQPAPAREVRYPQKVEAKLLNSLRAGDLRGAEAEVASFFSSLEEMGCDDAVRTIEQLCAVLAGFMRDSNIKPAAPGSRGIFDELARLETIGEMKVFLTGICRGIAIETGSWDTVFVDRMLDYVRANYRTIVDFEAMADAVGISYSHMRKLMREHTGQSILAYVHFLRIEEAKRLLSDRRMSISAMARRLGYNNIQSFERFFRKHNGVSAHEYRRLLQTGQLSRP